MIAPVDDSFFASSDGYDVSVFILAWLIALAIFFSPPATPVQRCFVLFSRVVDLVDSIFFASSDATMFDVGFILAWLVTFSTFFRLQRRLRCFILSSSWFVSSVFDAWIK